MKRRLNWVAKKIAGRVSCQVCGRVTVFRLDGQGGQDEQLFKTLEK